MNVLDPGLLTGGYVVSRRERSLRGPSGVPVPLSGRAFDVLSFLIEHRARVVTKDELMAAVWPRLVVEENNLTQAISQIRRAFNDSRESPKFIVTVAGRGYQWIARVDELEATPAAPAAPAASPPPPTADAVDPSRRRWLAIGAAGAAIAGLGLAGAWWSRNRLHPQPITSIAILPFHALTSGSIDKALELGMTETLINRLSSIADLKVSPLSSVRKYGGEETDPLAAARELGVQSVLEGRIQATDDRMRLTARLLDAEDGRALWSGSFDEPKANVLDAQDALTGRLLAALAISTPRIAASRALLRYTNDPAAWRYYLDGRYSFDQRTLSGFDKAGRDFEAALALDPNFVLPMVGLADTWALRGIFGIDPPVAAFNRSRTSAERALSLDPGLPPALTALGHVFLIFDNDFETAERLFRSSAELDPRQVYAELFLAMLATVRGQFELARRHCHQARVIEPQMLAALALEGYFLTYARQYDEARERLESLIAADASAPLPRYFLARLELLEGDARAALALLDGATEPGPGSFSSRGRALAMLGDQAGARAELARTLALGKEGFGVSYDLALLHLALGEKAEAIEALGHARGDHSLFFAYFNVDPSFDAIRAEAPVIAVAATVGRGRR